MPDDGRRTEATRFGFQTIVGKSAAIQNAVELSHLFAQDRRTVLIIGPTGTGKELFARALHYAGPTASDPFIVVNCAAVPEVLLDSELFGHEEDAFPGAREKRGLLEVAGAGTLFLDEISELPRGHQPKLLRVLEERRYRWPGGKGEVEIACRIAAASTRSLEEAVGRGEFREDLFQRLNESRINLPPLRERGGDVELLARHYLDRLAQEQGGEPKELAPDAIAAIALHSWPGNIRELRNVIERAALVASGPLIHATHLTIQRRISVPASSSGDDAAGEIRLPRSGKTLEAIEWEAIALAMQFTGGNQSAAARMLGISRATLARKMGDKTSPP
jgi:two-component system response regulator AtoC